jgi:hypothetical protein
MGTTPGFRFARGPSPVFLTVSNVKNFPHQYNDLAKLRATLETVRDLDEHGLDSADDAVLGYELARRMVYGFRGLDLTGDQATIDQRIAERLEIEKDKPAESQGTRTAAREMRRTLRYLGWLEEDGTALTPAGEDLLATTQGSDEETILMQQAIGGIEVDKDGHVSHPVQILLRLVDEVSLDSRKGMEVALEALDDSVPEFERVAEIAAMSEDDRISALQAAGWTTYQIANAVKILPAFALQSGLMTTDGSGHFILTDAGRRAIGRAIITSPPVSPTRRRRPSRPSSTSIATTDPEQVGRPRRLLKIDRRALTPEEQAMAAELLYQRTERHQALVRAVAAQCGRGEFYEDALAYDLLIDLGADLPLILIEVKTVAGDAAIQVRAAVGQLLYYEYFSVEPKFPEREIRRVAVVDDTVTDELADFLQANETGLIAYVDGEFTGKNNLGNAIANELFE